LLSFLVCVYFDGCLNSSRKCVVLR
jgi:hypothetical protein